MEKLLKAVFVSFLLCQTVFGTSIPSLEVIEVSSDTIRLDISGLETSGWLYRIKASTPDLKTWTNLVSPFTVNPLLQNGMSTDSQLVYIGDRTNGYFKVVGTPDLVEISTDPSSPSYRLVSGGSVGATVGVFKFRSTSQGAILWRLGLKLRYPDTGRDIVQVTLWDGTTKVGGAVFTGTYTNAIAILEPFVWIPMNTDKIITIKADFSGVGVGQAGVAGDLIAVDFDETRPGNTTAFGQESGMKLPVLGNAFGSGVTLARSIPIVALDPLPATGITDGRLMRFSVTANSAGDVSIGKFSFEISANSAEIRGASLSCFMDSSYSAPSANSHSLDLERSSAQSVAIYNDLGIRGGPVTIEYWINLESSPIGGYMMMLSYLEDAESHVSYFQYLDDLGSTYRIVAGRASLGNWNTMHTVDLGIGSWHHIAYTYDGANENLYLDGEKVAGPVSTSGEGLAGGNDWFFFSAYGGGSHFDGKVDDMRVWNTALSATVIADHYNNRRELAGNEPNLSAYWKFNNSYLDETANHYNLASVNSPVFSGDTPWSAGGGIVAIDPIQLNSGTAKISLYPEDGAGNQTPIVVPAGETRYFELRGNVITSGPTSSVSVRFLGDGAILPIGTFAETEANGGNFIWSGNSLTTSPLEANDWLNGFGVPGLPPDGVIHVRTQ